MTAKVPLYIIGMHGLGDCIHQRAIIKHLMQYQEIWLETPWPQIYHDLPIHLVDKGSPLRTQGKNADRNHHLFTADAVPPGAECVRIFYSPDEVRRQGGVLLAMVAHAGIEATNLDYRLPIPEGWYFKADEILEAFNPQKPILIYRPLIERKEWSGCAARNPDYEAYAHFIQSIRQDYFVISIADVVPGVEWIVGPDIKADAEFHRGQLDFETVAALVSRAALVYGSPGFAVVMGRSLQTPTVCVFGGYENSRSFRFGPGAYLGIDPIEPCECFQHHHACKKKIDLAHYEPIIKEFSSAALAPRKD